jgi:hypothetical protein
MCFSMSKSLTSIADRAEDSETMVSGLQRPREEWGALKIEGVDSKYSATQIAAGGPWGVGVR